MCPEFSLGPKLNKGRSVSNNVAISRGTDSCSVGHAGLWDEAASRTHVARAGGGGGGAGARPGAWAGIHLSPGLCFWSEQALDSL